MFFSFLCNSLGSPCTQLPDFQCLSLFSLQFFHLVARHPPEVGAPGDGVGKLLDLLEVVGHRHSLPDLLRGHGGGAGKKIYAKHILHLLPESYSTTVFLTLLKIQTHILSLRAFPLN